MKVGRLLAVAATLATTACIRLGAFPCESDSYCSLSPGGVCVQGWCAYPDEACGLRYSEQARDGLAGSCVDGASSDSATSGVASSTGSTSDGSNGSSPDTSDPSGGSTDAGASTTGPPPEDCAEVDCGQGTCLTLDGLPACRCDSGWYENELRCVPDPCETHTCYYVDANTGEDAAAGTTPDDPFETLGRALQEVGPDAAGDAILLRRGTTTGGTATLAGRNGADGAPFIIGAYGPVGDPRPTVRQLDIVNSSHVVVRDLEIGTVADPPKWCTRVHTTEHFTLYDSVIHDCTARGIRVENQSTYVSVVANEFYAINYDVIRVGDKTWEPRNFIGSHHYIVDNTLRGPFDGAPYVGLYSRADEATDFKYIGNRIDAGPIDSMRIDTGGAAWVINNTLGGGVALADQLRIVGAGDKYLAGNVVFGSAASFETPADSIVEHNTVVSTANSGWQFARGGSLQGNLILAAVAPVTTVSVPEQDIGVVADNWYGPAPAVGTDVCQFSVDGATWDFSQWSDAGLDTGGTCDAVPGIAVPPQNDAADWTDANLADSLTPAMNWDGCADDAGAFDCDGQRRPARVIPLPGAADGEGRGWQGPRLVRVRYPDLFGP